MPVFDMTEAKFLSNDYDDFSFGRPPQDIDIIIQLKGLQFKDTQPHATIYLENNLPIKVLHKNHLITAKLASNRTKDRDDVEKLP